KAACSCPNKSLRVRLTVWARSQAAIRFATSIKPRTGATIHERIIAVAYFDKGFVAVEDSSFGVGDGNQCGSGWKGIFLVRDGEVQSHVVPSMFFCVSDSC